MRKFYLIALVLFVFSQLANAQAPDTLWAKTFGGMSYDYANAIQQTFDSGYIISGKTMSNDGDVSGYHAAFDYWAIKLDMNGDTIWTKCLGGTGKDIAYSIVQTNDSCYIVTGQTGSFDGDVTGNHGGYDFWVVRLNNNSDILWQKCFGGTEYEISYSIQQTNDNGYIIAGNASSTDGDVHGNHGLDDFWVVKLNSNGDTLWTKSFGGPHNDIARSIRQTFDSGYVVAGYTYSVGGDVSGNHGSSDYWVIKLDSAGDTIWTKTLGGSDTDQAYAVRQTFDSGYIIAGYTYSNDGDVHGNRGSRDYWLVKLNNNGDTLWSKTYGGYESDEAFDVQQTRDSGFVVAGLTTSTDGDVEGNHGGSDYWIVKLDNDGQKDWTKCLGGSGYEGAYAIQQSFDLGYVMTGYAKSTDGDVHGNDGASDFWVVRLASDGSFCQPPLAQTETNITESSADLGWTEMGSATSWQIMLDTTGFDTTGYTSVTVTTNPFTWNSLASNTSYDWYVRADCSSDDKSEWLGPHTFTTEPEEVLLIFPPDTLWTNSYGGSDPEEAKSIQQTSDSGYIAIGYTQSNDGDVHGNHRLSADYWVVKLNGNGDTLWTKCLGGSRDDWGLSIQQMGNGGYIIAGSASSNDGEVHGNHGMKDIWIVQLNTSGDTLWTKTLGGSNNDGAFSVQQTYLGNFIVAGYSQSNDGDVHGNRGLSDVWVVKLNNSADTLWSKTYGGSDMDVAQSIQQTYDSGYILSAYTKSNDGDVTGNHGANDFWILKLDGSGDTLWTKCFGGTDNEYANAVQQTSDSGYVITGFTSSTDGDVHGNHGSMDFWVVRLNGSGDTLWTKTFGGSSVDQAYSIQQTYDRGYIVAGYTESTDKDVHGNNGISDFWIIKLNNNGDTLWTKCLGGSMPEFANSIWQTFDSGYILAGLSMSNDGDVHGNHGMSDFWVVKLSGDLNAKQQTIPLLSGWNIMSFNVTPNDTNMLHIVQPLIDSSELIKVQDEAGGFIQNIPGIGWMNTIGNMANTEGYYTKVNTNTQLQTTGLSVALPYTIPLTTGWNIMGYPLQQSQDALTAVQPLIDDDELIKVLDESGGFIQDIPGIGWMNTIGDFEAGEGYYIKVTDNTSITLDNPPVLFIGSPPIVQKQPQLYKVPKSNPYLPMNIIVTGINIQGYTLQNDDELAVFDNNRLTGAGVITTGNKALISFTATMDDPTTTEIDGYIEGNIPGFQFRSTNLTGSIQLTAKPVFGDLRFSPLGTLVCTLEGSLTAIEQKKEKTFALKCVPNPANNYTNIQYHLPEEGQLQLEVYDLSSHRIKTLQNEQQSAGSHTYRFDAALLERGIYLIKIQLRTNDNQFTEVVKFVKN